MWAVFRRSWLAGSECPVLLEHLWRILEEVDRLLEDRAVMEFADTDLVSGSGIYILLEHLLWIVEKVDRLLEQFACLLEDWAAIGFADTE